MQDERLFGGTMINPFLAKTRLPGLRRTWRRLTVGLAALGLLLAFLSPAWAGDGALDPTFITGPGPYAGVQTIPEIRGQVGYTNGTTGGIAWPYNGYQLLFGTFWGVSVNGVSVQNNNNSCIARLKADGTLDTGFLTNSQINGEIRGAYIYPHNDPYYPDKILIWGSFNVFSSGGGNPSYVNFARLNANGAVDTTLPQAIWWGGAVNAVGVQGAGTSAKILVGGYGLNTNNNNGDIPSYQLIRLNYDGSLDGNYTHWSAPGGYIFGIRVYSSTDPFPNEVRLWCSYPKNQDGSGGNYYMLLLDANAARPDITAPVASIGDELVDGPIYNMAKQSSDGKVIICGQFQHVKNSGAWVARNRVARLDPTMTTLDLSYDVSGLLPNGGPNDLVTQISPNSSTDDYMVLSGNFSTWNGVPVGYLVRLTTSGALDTNFPPGTGGLPGLAADDRIWKLNWKSDGNGGWIYGYFRSYNGQLRGGITGLNGNGSYNTNYANVTANAGWSGMVYSLAAQSDGKIIIGGDFNGVGGKYCAGLARINPNGSLDRSFRGGVDIGTNSFVRSVAVQADGKILLAGYFGQCKGYSCTSLARLNPDGSLDTAFNPMLANGDNSVPNLYQVVPLSNGQMMIAGEMWNDTIGDSPVARLYSDGTRDPNFNASGFSISGAQWGWGSRVAVVSTNAGTNYLIAGGYSTGGQNYWTNSGFLARLTSSGAVDNTFSPGTPVANIQTMDGEVDDLFLQPDGKIVVSGGFANIIGGPARRAIARFSANGLLDTTFTPSLALPTGTNNILIAAMAQQSNGKILIEENFFNNSSSNSIYLGTQVARLNSNGSLDFGFSLGTPTNGWFHYGAGNSILCLPRRNALIGGCYSNYNGTAAWSLVRILAHGNISLTPLMLLMGD